MVTTATIKGQIVIPSWVRRKLLLSPGEELKVELGPGPERIIILRGQTKNEVERLLEKGYKWLESTGENLVGRLDEARRKARIREAKGRAP